MICQYDEDFRLVKEKILSAEKIAIITHINPDGDCIGSSLALQSFIEKCGKTAEVFNEQGLPQSYAFMAGDKIVRTDAESDGTKYDLVIWADCGSEDRGGKISWVTENADVRINIDHHQTNTLFADINIVDGNAAATCIMIYEMFMACGVEIDLHTAELLYMGIITDSGNFSYSNADKRTHLVAGELLEIGVNVAELTQKLFRTTTYGKLKLTALTLDNLELFYDGKIAVLFTSKKMYAETNTSSEDSEGFVSMARDIKGVKIAVFLRDTTDGALVKVSLRSNADVDVSEIAKKFGGGGHEKAAGFSLPGTIPEVRDFLIKDLEQYI